MPRKKKLPILVKFEELEKEYLKRKQLREIKPGDTIEFCTGIGSNVAEGTIGNIRVQDSTDLLEFFVYVVREDRFGTVSFIVEESEVMCVHPDCTDKYVN